MVEHLSQWVKKGKFSLLGMMCFFVLACLVSLWIKNTNLTLKNKDFRDELILLKDQNQDITELNQKLLDWVKQKETSHDVIVGRQVYYIKKWMDPIGKLEEHILHVIEYCKLKKEFSEFYFNPDEMDRLHRLRRLIKYDIDEGDDEIIVPLALELIAKFKRESDKYLNALLSMNFEEMKQLQDDSTTDQTEDIMRDVLENISALKSRRKGSALQIKSLVDMVGNAVSKLIPWVGHWVGHWLFS